MIDMLFTADTEPGLWFAFFSFSFLIDLTQAASLRKLIKTSGILPSGLIFFKSMIFCRFPSILKDKLVQVKRINFLVFTSLILFIEVTLQG